jgi:predicted transcriptional regulator
MIPWTQQRGRAVPRPKTGETPIRHVRVDDNLWSQIGEIAAGQGRTVTAVVVDALKRYVAWHKRQQKRDDA